VKTLSSEWRGCIGKDMRGQYQPVLLDAFFEDQVVRVKNECQLMSGSKVQTTSGVYSILQLRELDRWSVVVRKAERRFFEVAKKPMEALEVQFQSRLLQLMHLLDFTIPR
jgi:hypothetical protein